MAWAALAAAIVTVAVVVDVGHTGNSFIDVVRPGEQGPSIRVFRHDFPGERFVAGLGHDGQQYYAIARQPMHIHAVAKDLDQPRYRLQRPLFPWLAWLLHPTGGGRGLIVAMFVVGVAAVLGTAVAAGALVTMLGGPAFGGAVVALLPSSFITLRLGTADNLALALVIGAIALSIRGWQRTAIVAGVLAVLAREPVLVALFGFALWRRDREGIVLAAVPAVVVVALAAYLTVSVKEPNPLLSLGAPFVGLASAARQWVRGHDSGSLASAGGACLLAALAVVHRRLRHPLAWATVAQGALVAILSRPTLLLFVDGARSTAGLLAFAALLVLAPAPSVRPARAAPASSR